MLDRLSAWRCRGTPRSSVAGFGERGPSCADAVILAALSGRAKAALSAEWKLAGKLISIPRTFCNPRAGDAERNARADIGFARLGGGERSNSYCTLRNPLR